MPRTTYQQNYCYTFHIFIARTWQKDTNEDNQKVEYPIISLFKTNIATYATKSTKEMEINSTETCTALKYKTKIAIECQLTGMTQKTGTREKTLRIRIEKSL